MTSFKKRIERINERIQLFPLTELLKLERWIDSRDQKAFSIKQAADHLNMCADTIRKAVREKRIRGFQINKLGAWRIPKEELERFMEEGK